MPKIADIPEFTQDSPYKVDQPVTNLEAFLKDYIEDGLQMEPDFQRGHVWTEAQQVAYVEYVLQGGKSGRDIYFNHPGWMGNWKGEFVLVDGLQRLTALLKFLRNEIKVFGYLYREYDDKMRFSDPTLRIHVNTLKTRGAVLRWYLEMNTGGTPHTQAEIERVKALWAEEAAKKGKK